MENLGRHAKSILIVALLAILVLLIRDFNSRMSELRRLQGEVDLVSTQYIMIAATRSALETQVAFAESDEAVRRYLYEQGKYSQPGDVVILPIPGEGSEVVQTVPAPTLPPPVAKWQLWLALFFDPKAP